MNKSIISPLIAGLMIIALLVHSSITSNSQTTIPETEGIEVAQAMGLDLSNDQRRGEALIEMLPTDVLGSLAPIALSPFFALTCLSGASLAAEVGLLPESVANNFMMSANSPLNHGPVFVGLLVLTLLTAAPKLTKVSKPFAQAVDQLEGYSGIIAAIAVQVLSRVTVDDPGTQELAIVYSAGIITTSYATLLMAFSAINIFVVNSVKFFCEVMILISPIPTIDAIFEVINKAFTAFLITVYLFSPFAATVLNLLIFLVCLAIFAWTYRRVVFMRCVLGDPFFGWFAEAIFRMRLMTEKSTKLPKSILRSIPEPTVILKAFAGKKMKGIKKKVRGFLVHADGNTYFVRPRLLGSDKIVELSAVSSRAEVRPGFFSHSVVFTDSMGGVVQKVLFTKRYNNSLERIHRSLNAGGTATHMQQAHGLSDIGKSFSDSINSADKAALRSEFT